jgi:hypothetical protein
MTYERTLGELKSVLGEVERPEELERYSQILLSMKDEIVNEVLSGINLPEEKRAYMRGFVEEFYTSLIMGTVESFWRGRYEQSFENVRKDISMEVNVFVASKLASVLTRKIIGVAGRDAEKILPYVVGAVISGLAFSSSARADMEYDFLGIDAGLMDRIRRFGAGEGD